MPTISLIVQDDNPARPDAPVPPDYIPHRRVRMWLALGVGQPMRQAVVDTGAPVMTLSKRSWAELELRQQIAWVRHPPADIDLSGLPTTTVLGGTFPFRLGRISVEPLDAGNFVTALSPVEVLAICIEDGRALPAMILLGLAGVMHGRTFRLSASADGNAWAASLSDEPPGVSR